MNPFTRELRHAWRSLRRRKAYYLTCAATLTLVLGANAALFAVVNATLLRPMPFATRGAVVHVFAQPPGTTAVLQRNPLQQMEVPRIRERARTLAGLEGFYLSERVVTLRGEPGVAPTGAVTPGLLTMLAVPVAQGRSFVPSEGEPGHFVALVTDRYWRDALGSGSVLGTPLVIDGQPHTIVGVLAPKFAVPFLDAQVFTPLVATAEALPRSPARTVVAVAELAPGASLAQAREELTAIHAQMTREFPATHAGWTIGAEWAREWQYGSMRAPLLMLLAAMAFVLLIACVNIANLTSAQAVARAGELSLRVALGASKRDLLRVHLAELTIVCASGLVPGLLLAWSAVPALLAIHPTIARTLGPVSIDWRVQAFSALVAVLTAVVASAVPAIRSVRGETSATLAASTSRTTGSPRALRVQRVLVSLEAALCLALLMAGAVLVQGLRDLSRRSPGYEPTGVLTAHIRLPESYRTPELRAAVVKRLLDDIRALPGVVSASTTQNIFLPGFSYQTMLAVKDRPTEDGQPQTVQFRRVSSEYFKTLRIKTVSGRVITDDDTADRPAVVVVSRQFAERLLPGLDPIGRIVMRSPNVQPLTIVGVVDDVSDVTVTARPEPTLYQPWAQNNNTGAPVTFVIRAAVDPASLAPAVRDALRRVDESLPLRRVQTLEAFVNESIAPERFRTMVLGILATLGLVLAAIGISGVTYRSVIDRTRDFAVRLALGSGQGAVVRLVLVESVRDLAIGAVAGLAGGAALCVLLGRTLENVGSVDAPTTAVSIAVIAVVGIAAALLPALRILRLHPAQVLRG